MPIKRLAFCVIGLFLVLTLALILFPLLTMQDVNPALGDFIWLLWPAAPFALMVLLAWAVSTRAAMVGMMTLVVVASVLGVGVIMDVLFVHPDPQGPVAVFLVPVWQLALLVVVGLPLLLGLNMVRSSGAPTRGGQSS